MDFDRADELFAIVRDPSGPFDRKVDALKELLGAHQVLSFDVGRGSIFYRARKCEPHGFDNESSLFHPPAELTGAQRLNEAGEPVLYLSARAETAVAEIGPREGDHIQIAGFRIVSHQTLRIAALGEIDHVIRTGHLRTLGQDPNKAIQRTLNSVPAREARVWQYIDAFLADLLAQTDKAVYPLTRAIAALAFAKSSAHAMFYPSVQYNVGMNLAVQNSHADHLEMVLSRVVRIGKVRDYGFVDQTVVRQAQTVDKKGRFLWSAMVDDERGYLFRITEAEFKQANGKDVTLLDLPTEQALGEAPEADLGEAIHRGLRLK